MAGAPGETNVQINVPLLLNNLWRYSKIAWNLPEEIWEQHKYIELSKKSQQWRCSDIWFKRLFNFVFLLAIVLIEKIDSVKPHTEMSYVPARASWKVKPKFFKFVVCNLCQSSPSLTILVPLWFIIISLVFYILVNYYFKFSSIKGQFCVWPKFSKWRDWAPSSHFQLSLSQYNN